MAERLPRYLLTAARTLAGAGLLLLAVLPRDWLAQAPAVCLFKNIFGIECFGCGMTRALSSALHGHLAEALAFNRGVVLVLPLLVVFVLLGSRVRLPLPDARGSVPNLLNREGKRAELSL